MGLSEPARQALKGQADELVDEIRKIEQPIERLLEEREALQKQIDEIKSGSRDLKEAVNVLMNLIGEEKPYGEPKANDSAPAAADYESPGSGRAERRCPKCKSTVYVGVRKKGCPKPDCDGALQVPNKDPDPGDDPDEDDLDSDDDIDSGSECSDPPMPVDDEEWRRPGPGTIKKGCNRCNRAVHVLPHCTICPDESCRGNLVDTKK